MCPGKLIPIFVYGTLIPSAKEISEGMEPIDDVIENVTMHNLGNFPAIVKGDGTAKGKVLCVSEEMLKHLDRYEGVDQGLYYRVQTITKGGRPVNVYFFKRSLDGFSRGVIEDGDWMSHVDNY